MLAHHYNTGDIQCLKSLTLYGIHYNMHLHSNYSIKQGILNFYNVQVDWKQENLVRHLMSTPKHITQFLMNCS